MAIDFRTHFRPDGPYDHENEWCGVHTGICCSQEQSEKSVDAGKPPAPEKNEDDALEEPAPAVSETATTLEKPLILLKDLHAAFCTDLEWKDQDDKSAVQGKQDLEEALGITMSAAWLKTVERSLEALFWQLYSESCSETERHTVYVADSKRAGGVKDKVMLVSAPQGIDLMYCGNISQTPSPHSKHVLSLAGVDFYVHPPAPPPAGDVCVPAWLAKATTKQDNVTLKPNLLTMEVYLKETGEIVACCPDVSARSADVVQKLAKAAEKLQRRNHAKTQAISSLEEAVEQSRAKIYQERIRADQESDRANCWEATALSLQATVWALQNPAETAETTVENETGPVPAKENAEGEEPKQPEESGDSKDDEQTNPAAEGPDNCEAEAGKASQTVTDPPADIPHPADADSSEKVADMKAPQPLQDLEKASMAMAPVAAGGTADGGAQLEGAPPAEEFEGKQGDREWQTGAQDSTVAVAVADGLAAQGDRESQLGAQNSKVAEAEAAAEGVALQGDRESQLGAEGSKVAEAIPHEAIPHATVALQPPPGLGEGALPDPETEAPKTPMSLFNAKGDSLSDSSPEQATQVPLSVQMWMEQASRPGSFVKIKVKIHSHLGKVFGKVVGTVAVVVVSRQLVPESFLPGPRLVRDHLYVTIATKHNGPCVMVSLSFLAL